MSPEPASGEMVPVNHIKLLETTITDYLRVPINLKNPIGVARTVHNVQSLKFFVKPYAREGSRTLKT